MKNNYKSFKNLYKGLKKSCRNVRWKTSVTSYEINGLKNTARLIRELKNGNYKISEYQTFQIHEPKERTIHATRIKDRQFQRSLCDNYLYEELTKHFIHDNCACQLGKGTFFAVDRLKTHLHRFFRKHKKNGYYLKCDIRHFFDSIPHDVAKAIIVKYVKDEEVRQYVFDIIDSFEGDVGIGLGSQVSQLIALAILDELDHIIKEVLHIKFYVRYMDDFILIHEDSQYLKYCLDLINNHLSSLGLELNQKTSIQPLRHGLTFLHWRFIITETGKVIMTQEKCRSKRRKRKIQRMITLIKNNAIQNNIVKDSINGCIAHLGHGNCFKEINGLIDIVELQN